jgi:hypothetical protein
MLQFHGYCHLDGLNLQFPEELHDCHLENLKPCLGALVEHDDNVGCHSWVDVQRNVHHEDVCFGLANASTWCQGRRGEGFHRENGCCLMFIYEQQCALNMLALSSDPGKLLDNKIHCPWRKTVSK